MCIQDRPNMGDQRHMNKVGRRDESGMGRRSYFKRCPTTRTAAFMASGSSTTELLYYAH